MSKKEVVYKIFFGNMYKKRKNVRLHYKINFKKNLFHSDLSAYELANGVFDEIKESGINKNYYYANKREHLYDEDEDY